MKRPTLYYGRILLAVCLIAGAAAGVWLKVQAPSSATAEPAFQQPALVPTRYPIPPEAADDPALYNPTFASLFYAHGRAWDQNLHPDIRRMVDWQRAIGRHALISGSGIGNPGFAYPEPRFVLSVTEWDHSDLFALGIPRSVDDRPVVIIEMGFATML